MNAKSFAFDHPSAAIDAIASQLATITESEVVDSCHRRVLANDVVSDRDSPAADVSAMDGYAVRLEQLTADKDLPIAGLAQAGSPPPTMVTNSVARIFTGAIVPVDADAVLKREDTEELGDHIRVSQNVIDQTNVGEHIRRVGENAAAGSLVAPAGKLVTPAVMATLANFGATAAPVKRQVRIVILTTGDEVLPVTATELKPWQLRNSNQATIRAVLATHPWIKLVDARHIKDDLDSLKQHLQGALEEADAIVMTGGVSKGDYDFVPDAIAAVDGQVVFHGLPIRPGKPILGAATSNGKLILGLPGNPVSSAINANRFLVPLLRRIAGVTSWQSTATFATVKHATFKTVPLHTMLLARHVDDGNVELVPSKGSGDLVALGQSDGYICLPPSVDPNDSNAIGPWPFYSWS